MLWLNGAAGAGKTAIAQSVVDLCVERGIHAAVFFIFRVDPTRNTLRPLVGTLVYQIMLAVPSLGAYVLDAIAADPLVFAQSVETQLKRLVIEPVKKFAQANENDPEWRVILIIDGVDECEEGESRQTYLVHILARLLATGTVPLRVLVASRAETHLVSAFAYAEHYSGSEATHRLLLRLPLDARYHSGEDTQYILNPGEDIRLFVNDTLEIIRTTHPLRHLLVSNRDGDDGWPPARLVQTIVEKASGQFIYASVALKFLANPRADPLAQARMLINLQPAYTAHASSLTSPFAQLDALYTHILSQIPESDLPHLMQILAYAILGHTNFLSNIASYLNISMGEAEVALGGMRAVIACDAPPSLLEGRVRFLHASLPDFLLNPTRAGAYHIDRGLWGSWLSVQGLQRAAKGLLDSTSWFDACYHMAC